MKNDCSRRGADQDGDWAVCWLLVTEVTGS